MRSTFVSTCAARTGLHNNEISRGYFKFKRRFYLPELFGHFLRRVCFRASLVHILIPNEPKCDGHVLFGFFVYKVSSIWTISKYILPLRFAKYFVEQN